MNALEVIVSYYNQSPQYDIYHEVVGHLLNNLTEVEEATIYDMAAMCFVSTTTISRLSKKFGYKSYIEFKMALAEVIKNYTYHNRYFPMNAISKDNDIYTTYSKTMQRQIVEFQKEVKNIDVLQIVRDLHKHRKVNFYLYNSSSYAAFFQMNLLISGVESIVVVDPMRQIADAKTLDEGCAVIIDLPDLRESINTRNIIKIAKEKKALIVLLTNSVNTDFIEYADYCYKFEGMNTILDGYKMDMFLNVLSMEYRYMFIK
jgi:DNA-binding MurR/RpiR family transcriptional regulator